MPSWEFRTATAMLRTCDRIFSEMDRPAASSFALLMRRPEESRWTEVASFSLLLTRFLWALIEAMFVLMTRAIAISSLK